MERRGKRVTEALRTAVAFLLIFSCMVTASAVSVRAEERMEEPVVESITEEKNAQNEVQQSTTHQNEEMQNTELQGEEAAGGAQQETPQKQTEEEEENNGNNIYFYSEDKTMGDASGQDSKEEEETQTSDSAPIGRRYAVGDYGTAYVMSEDGIMLFSTVGSDCTITPGTQHNYGSWVTNEFYVLTEKGNYMGYCAQPNKQTPSGHYQVSQLDNDRIKMALMFGADGPWAKEASALFGGVANPYPYVHAMIGVEYTGETNGLTNEQITAMRTALEEQMNSGKAQMAIFQEYTVYVAYNDRQDIVWLEYSGPIDGRASLRKTSSNPSATDGNACYSLGGAEYGIYVDAACTRQVSTFVTNEAGESEPVELTEGDYWVKEIQAPQGYRKDSTIYPIHVNAGADTVVQVSDVPESVPAELEITKKDQETEKVISQGNATFAGAQFTVKYYQGYYEEHTLPATPTRTWVLETKEMVDPDGGPSRYRALLDERHKVSGDDFYMSEGKVVLPLGTIAIEETKAPDGYLLEGAYLQVGGSEEKISGPYISQIRERGNKISLIGGNKYTIYDKVARGGVKILKRDFETKAAHPLGGASFENTVFTIVNLNENAVFVGGKSYGRNEEVASIRSNLLGIAQTENDLLPFGKYRIIETGAPQGYLEEGVLCREFMITKDGEMVELIEKENSIENQVKRGDFELRKIDSETQDVMRGVQFKVTSVTTGESHLITTDENGYYCSATDWNKHSHNTNQGGKEDGLWFGVDKGANKARVNDELGALPYDTYELEEIPGDANEGKVMLKTTFVIYKDRAIVNLGNLENKGPEEDTPAISTSARNEATGDHYGVAGNVTIVDAVIYSGLREKEEYLLKCMPVNKSTGEPVVDEEGNKVVAEKKFTAAAAAGIVEVECTFDASRLGGLDVVIFEELYSKAEKVAEHKEIEDEEQTIHFPEIGTKAGDAKSGMNSIVADEEVSIVDTVSYENLKVGQEYTLIGKLMDKETEQIVKDAAGQDVTSETKFVPKETNGKVEVLFTFDGSLLEGKTLVAYERLERNGKVYAVHADIHDEEQTVYFPMVRTTAKDVKTNSRDANAQEETVIVDSVFYSNLTAGQEYTVEGILMDKETETPLLQDGKEITAKTTFTPEEESGTVDVTFEFDASALAGKTAVAYESVTRDGEEVAVHKDINYEEQTVRFHEPEEEEPEKEETVVNIDNGNEKPVKPVKTGDSLGILPALILLVLSFGVLFAAARRKIG